MHNFYQDAYNLMWCQGYRDSFDGCTMCMVLMYIGVSFHTQFILWSILNKELLINQLHASYIGH